MNQTKKMRSISRSVNRSWVLQLFAIFLLFDILAFSMASWGWCWFQETSQGQDFQINTPRHFELLEKEDIPKSGQKLAESAGRWIQVPLENTLIRIQYVHEAGGRETTVYAGRFLVFACRCMAAVMLIQLLILLIDMLTGSRRARKHLAPLYEISQMARDLTSQAAFDEEKFHHLEDAISQISPTGTDSKLRTGDAELAGLELAVNNLLERMRQSYQQQARFVSDASHELRTPIAVIQGYANMLDRWGKDDENILEESIAAIKSESDHMKKLVEQLLFLARGDSGRTKLVMEEFSLTETIKEVFDESVMIDSTHRYQLKADEDIRVIGDVSMVKQAARILVDNAVKYTPEGSEILLKTGINDKGAGWFAVQDEGIGISQEDVTHMFERFFRSDPARSRESGGTGLGLSIAKWIIDRHGGSFQVLSWEDIGTRITVCFPSQPQD